ncbi:hypothetical protein F5878DRAFT_92193 [Lentinula raphanica]|uniref:Dihydrodipicolinate synthetase n=1 Tax=Lentinula raphanica TaxID=153919 RepID=A0AA38PBN2_9AGAR|nr:hypothetical protein F5878DRAFT_92193 [Lentinula raphanica]
MVIIAGTGAQSARQTKELGVQAKESGAGWVLVLTLSTWAQAMGPVTILEYHREVADACPLPYMIYNNPTVTVGIDLDSNLISSLATHTKLSSFDYQTSFATIGAKSDAHLRTLLSSGTGTIPALVNIVPKVHTKIYKIFLEYQKTKDVRLLEEAYSLQEKLSIADWAMMKIGTLGGVKAIVAQEFGYGNGNGKVRLPLREVNLGVVVQSEQGAKWWKAVEEVLKIEKSL